MTLRAAGTAEQLGVLAHGGGAPEAAMIGAPVLVVLVPVRVWRQHPCR